tara:strand:+ start:404 stop:1126 length:723 start_codon:yes stop_codon:yes gene_type:complete
MSGGGGKGGSKTTETTIPAWIRDPAIRNLQRAEDVQRIEYMPYYGPDVAAFTPTQNAAFDANIGAAQAFGLLDPNSNLTATSGMPTPTDFDGFSGYSSQPIYESALAELKANQPDAVAQYDALFGANVPTTRSTGQGGFRGSANVSSPTRSPQGIDANTMMASGSPNARGYVPSNPNYKSGGGAARARQAQREALAEADHMRQNATVNYNTGLSSRLDSKGATPARTTGGSFYGNPNMGK